MIVIVRVIVSEAIPELRSRRYDVRERDVQQPAFDAFDGFEVVVMGELIEHLTDFETALANVRAWLEPDGRLLITTPNALSAPWLVYRFRAGRSSIRSTRAGSTRRRSANSSRAVGSSVPTSIRSGWADFPVSFARRRRRYTRPNAYCRNGSRTANC